MKRGTLQAVILVLLVGLLTSATACVAPAAPALSMETQTVARTAPPVPFATPKPFDYTAQAAREAELQAEAAQRFWSAFSVDFSPLYDSMKPNMYHRLAQVWDVLAQMETRLKAAGRAAAVVVEDAYPHAQVRLTDVTIDLPWRQMAGLYYNYGTRLHEYLEENLAVEVRFVGEDLKSLRVTLPDFFTLAQGSTPNDAYRARTVYFYLNTVFTDEGERNPTLHDEPYLPDTLMDRLVPPLPHIGRPYVRNTWAEGRSKRTRLHMGTDIRIVQVPIFSCSDGTVLFSDYNTVSGNYVCVVDEAGYEYQYMHLRELSPFVKPGDEVRAGQQIGVVGSTGNSTANHLHLSMVSPDHQYMNTYFVVRDLARRDLWSKKR